MKEVKVRQRGASRISAKHQITIPIDALRAAGLEAGERVIARAEGAGRVVLEREHDVLGEDFTTTKSHVERAAQSSAVVLSRLGQTWPPRE